VFGVRRTLNVTISILSALATFAVTLYSAFTSQVAFFGPEAYENNAGPQFGAVMSSLFLAVVAAMIAGVHRVSCFGYCSHGKHICRGIYNFCGPSASHPVRRAILESTLVFVSLLVAVSTPSVENNGAKSMSA
jgi:hypothetical protein